MPEILKSSAPSALVNFPIHSAETAPPDAQDDMADISSKYGRVPNMLGAMAEAPALLKGYRFLRDAFEATSLDASERNVVLLAISYENNCRYCVAAHSVMAKMQKVPDGVIDAIREGVPIPNQKLQALRQFTTSIVASRGEPTAAAMQAFFAAGFTQANALEVILGVGMKTLSNYTNHLTNPPLDDGYASAAWTRPA